MALTGKSEEDIIREVMVRHFEWLFTDYKSPAQRIMEKQDEQGYITGKDVVEACKSTAESLIECANRYQDAPADDGDKTGAGP